MAESFLNMKGLTTHLEQDGAFMLNKEVPESNNGSELGRDDKKFGHEDHVGRVLDLVVLQHREYLCQGQRVGAPRLAQYHSCLG